jgi:DNA-binding NarL/FixJ family response regulator
MAGIPRKIVIADPQFLVVESLKTLLNQDEQFSVQEVVQTKRELTISLSNAVIDLLIIDPILLDFDGFDELKQVKMLYPDINILVLTNSITKTEFGEFSKIGIRNIIYKMAGKTELLMAVDAALKGKKYFSEEILDLILELNETKGVPEEPVHLTNSEIEIVRMISSGLTTKEIAFQKNISFHTVNTHRKNIFRKMGVTNASELIMQAIKAGWIDNIEYFI